MRQRPLMVRFIFAIVLCLMGSALAATYPYPKRKTYMMGGPYADHLANHAFSIDNDIQSGELEILTDERELPIKIVGGWDSSTIKLHWSANGKTLAAVDITANPIAPDFTQLKDPTFLKYISDVLIENTQSWGFFLTRELGRLQTEYWPWELADLLNKKLEVRIRVRFLPPKVLQRLQMIGSGRTPFRVSPQPGGKKLSLDEILKILSDHSLSKCETALANMPISGF